MYDNKQSLKKRGVYPCTNKPLVRKGEWYFYMKGLFIMIISLVSLFSIGGVYATWRFADLQAEKVQEEMSVELLDFQYDPEQLLPGGVVEDAVVGGNHYVLIDLVLNEDNKGYGLNINDNVLIHQYLQNNRVIYSNQKISGGNLKHILDAQNNTHGLYYCIQKISDTEYYCFTFSTSDLLLYEGSNLEIEAYRTRLVKTDIWRATTSAYGHATVRRLTDLGPSADPKSIPYSIDVTTWHTK